MVKQSKNQPLYKYKDKKIYQADFVGALEKVGINKGDTIFVHSDVAVFGKPCTFDWNFLLGSLTNAIKETVGKNGIIIMPAFSYSFCNNEDFDVENTKSIVGVLTEYFWKQLGVSRTTHPIFSVGIWGKNKERFLNVGKDCFDDNSIFGKFHRANGKIVFFGAPFQSLTFLHYIEQKHGIPYRYIKTFKGKIKKGNKIYDDECTYLVRYLDKNVVTDLSRLEKHLLNKGLMKEVKIGAGKILMIKADVLFKEGCKLLDKNIYFFLKEKPE